MKTIYDVAKAAGYAPSTVSKYLTHHGYVSQAAGKKIEQAMVDLDYHYNGLARLLNEGASSRLGIMVPYLDQPYFQELVQSIMNVSVQQQREVIILPTNYDTGLEQLYLDRLEHQLIGQLIITSHALPLEQIVNYQKFAPIVVCERSAHLPIRSVYNDRLGTFKQLFEKIKAAGQTHIGLILARPASQSRSTEEVLTAYAEVFGEKIAPNLVRYHGKTLADGIREAKQLQQIDDQLQVVLTEGDTTAAGAYSEYQKSGTKVTVIGQGNELPSQLLGFSTIDYHLGEVGRQAVALLAEEDVRSVAVPVEIVDRK